MTYSSKRRGAFAAVILALLLMLSQGMQAFAVTDYITSWNDWKAAGKPSSTWNDVADAMDQCFSASASLYEAGDTDSAYKAINAGYYNYYEVTGFERTAMGHIAGSRKTEVELQFSKAKTVTKSGGTLDELKAELVTLMGMIRRDANVLDGITQKDDPAEDASVTAARLEALISGGEASSDSKTESGSSGDSSKVESADSKAVVPGENAVAVGGTGGGWGTFAACFGIILREGLEAILVVGAIIAYLVKKGHRKKLKVVYAGCILAIGASFLSAWLLEQLKLANSANQEIIEGVTALIAVVVLFYVSNWMVSKAEADAWNKYIEGQVETSADTGSVFTLGFTAFLAVYREGAEVILFYQPLMSDDESKKMMWGGFGVGCVVLAVVFLAIRFLSVKLPLKPFFLGTSILMFIMSISFLGSGIKELIEGDVIMMTTSDTLQNLIPSNDFFDVLGIYPCYETLIPQLILITLTVTIFVIQRWKRNNHIECGVVAILLGTLGLHKFYNGKYGRGMLYVLFCWTGIPTVVGFLEGAHYIIESQEEYEEELKPKPKKPREKKQKQTPAKAK